MGLVPLGKRKGTCNTSADDHGALRTSRGTSNVTSNSSAFCLVSAVDSTELEVQQVQAGFSTWPRQTFRLAGTTQDSPTRHDIVVVVVVVRQSAGEGSVTCIIPFLCVQSSVYLHV